MMRKLWIVWLVLLGILSPVSGQEESQNWADIIALDWDRAGNRLAIGYEGGAIKILDTQSGNSINIGQLAETSVLSIDWHPMDDNLIAVGAISIYYRIYDITQNEIVGHAEVRSTSVSSVSWNVDGTLIATAANWVRDIFAEPRVDIWDATTHELVTSFQHSGFITDVQWHPTDPFKLVSTTDKGDIRFWDVNLSDEYRPAISIDSGSGHALWNHDGSQIAISQGATGGCLVSVWDVDELEETPSQQFEIKCYINLAWKNDGTLAISEESTYHITDVEAREIFETGELTLPDGPEYVNALDWSVNGDLAVGGTDDTLVYFKPNTYYIVDEASDLARFINMANANTSMNIFDLRGDFELTEALPQITGKITIIGDEAQLTTLRESGMLSVADGGQLSFEIREITQGA